MALQDTSNLGLGSFLVDAWNTAAGTFQRWIDHELGLGEGEVELAYESQQHANALNQHDAPASGQVIPGVSNTALLALGGGLILVAALLLRR